jgi:hypothetical protein
MRKYRSHHFLCAKVFLIALVVVLASGGCGGAANGEGDTEAQHVISTRKAKRLLLRLPYRYRWRKVDLPYGASGALAGAAIGKHHTVLHFGVSLGAEAHAVPIPRVGTVTPYYYPKGGFVFNSDLEVPGKGDTVKPGEQFHSAAQWTQAVLMELEMTEKLCRAATGEVCPP